MPWLKLLHIGAVILWCGSILYLPGLLQTGADGWDASRPLNPEGRLGPRVVFIALATPAALMAVISGTVLFLSHGLTAVWLVWKLAAVGVLVLAHAVCGLLVLRAEAGRLGQGRFCRTLQVGMLVTLLFIAWLVLRKPS